jgi:hypothetical protein
MKRIFLPGMVSGVVLLVLSILGLYATIWFMPKLALQYYDPTFDTQSARYMLYFAHPFIISLALSWFWDRFKTVLTGSFFTRGVEFGLLYVGIAIFPLMWLIYSAINVSILMVGTWFVFGLLQGVIAGLVFEKMNP